VIAAPKILDTSLAASGPKSTPYLVFGSALKIRVSALRYAWL
jgi:hypothetical protein